MVWSTLGRMIVVPIAFVIAALVAVAVLLSLGYERIVQATTVTAEFAYIEVIIDLLQHGALIAPAVTILPALALVIVGEVARIRSGLYYVAAGGMAVTAIPVLARFGQQATSSGSGSLALWHVFATAGFAGGLVYWLIAGRRA